MKLVVPVVAIVGLVVLAYRWIGVAVEGPEPTVHVDTLRVETHANDTVTIVSRARDTVRVIVRGVGPLTSQELTRLVCGEQLTYGDARDAFRFNVFGMVFCPRTPEDVER